MEDFKKTSHIAVIILIGLFAYTNTVFAAEKSDLLPMEKWILEKLSVGDKVELTKYDPVGKAKVIRASFLEKLIATKKYKQYISSRGIRIAYGIVKEPIILRNSLVEQEVQLVDFKFEKNIDFSNSKFKQRVVLNRNTFLGDVYFEGVQGKDVAFKYSHFHKMLTFSHADLASVLDLNKAVFLSKKGNIHLNGGKFLGIFFRGTTFNGCVNSAHARIIISLDLNNTQFHGNGCEIDFTGVTVGRTLFLNGVQAQGRLNFRGASLASIEMYGSAHKYNNPYVHSLDLSFSYIKDNIEIEGSKIKSLNMAFSQTDKSAMIKNVHIEDEANFANTKFNTLVLERVVLPDKNKSNLTGASFFNIMPVSKGVPAEKDWDELINLIELTSYSPSVYVALETYFLRNGFKENADKVFIKNKRRERRERLHGVRWIGSMALDVLVLYGRKPSLAFIWGSLIILIGWYAFRQREGMIQQGSGDTSREYSPFWYSLDLFIPVVDLYSARIWMPISEKKYSVVYSYVHRLLGWILVPTGLAALTGLVK